MEASTMIGILAGALAIIMMLALIFAPDYESIRVDSLDGACQTLLNDTYAFYYEEFGTQKHFTCRLGDQISVYEKADKFID